MVVTVGLHLWKRNMLISIAAGTVIYMILVQAIFNVTKSNKPRYIYSYERLDIRGFYFTNTILLIVMA